MKKIKWMTLMVSICLVLGLFAGCDKNNENPEPPVPTNPSSSSQGQEKTETLAQIFPQDGEEHFYHGYSEFGYSLKFEKREEKDGKTTLVYQGYMIDGEGDDPNDRTFKMVYELSEDGAVCRVEKSKEFGTYDSLHLMNSAVEEQSVLKFPLERGNKWEEEFIFRGRTYTAHSEIVDVYKSASGNTCYNVTTHVDGIDGFLGNTYDELRVYEEGKGLTKFENKLPLSVFSSESMGMTEDDYKFMYSLVEN
ncbi:hypothetical protein [Filifactor alocis]|uniref:hypothetical protein n=1 Tax=Filifactor alocis TaxID=143361 RepID=UPI003C6F1A3C